MNRTISALTLTVLLITMLCLTAAADKDWFFQRKWSPFGLPVKSVVFYGNSTVLFDQNNEIWKWNLINDDQLKVNAGHEVSDIAVETDGQVGTLYRTVIYNSVQRRLLSEASGFHRFAQDATFKVKEVGYALRRRKTKVGRRMPG